MYRSGISLDSDNIQISSLYKQCYSLQYQLNWIDRTLNRLRKIYQPEKLREYKSRIHQTVCQLLTLIIM